MKAWALIGLLGLTGILSAAENGGGAPGAASTAALERRLQEIEARLEALAQENAALRAQLGRPAASGVAQSPGGGAVGSGTAAGLPKAPASSGSTVETAGAIPAGLAKGVGGGSEAGAGARRESVDVRLTGDLRTRWQGTYDAAEGTVGREQWIVRVRTGLLASFGTDWEGGVRITAGSLNANYGGTPLSTQYTLADNAAQKYVFFDQTYLRWKTTLPSAAKLRLTMGKMENPFYVPSNLIFDVDYTPEGAVAELTGVVGKNDRWQVAAGALVLDELATATRDPWFFGLKARWEHAWNEGWTTTATVQYLPLLHPEQLTAANIANNNFGNTRTVTGTLVYDYQPLYGEATTTRLLAGFPGYPGKFPVTLQGEYVYNPGAPEANRGYGIGLVLGKAGSAGKWEFTYRRLWLEDDAIFEEFAEGDYGGYRPVVPVGWNTDAASTKGGHLAMTGYRMHLLRGTYSLRDYLNLSTSVYLNDVIRQYRTGVAGGATRVQVDALLKF